MGAQTSGLPAALGLTELTSKEFDHIRKLAHQKFGLNLHSGKEAMVTARLSRALRRHNFRSFREYYEFVQGDRTGRALQELIDALTTNFTNFLREPSHFHFLTNTVVPQLRHQPRIEFWSAACSSGEEPYSIALTMLDALGEEALHKVRILATDICVDVLEKTREGVYAAERLAGLPPAWLQRYFEPVAGSRGSAFRVKTEVRRMVTVLPANLIEPFRPGNRFHVIFCRNVMIYFDRQTQGLLVQRMEEVLQPDGYLMIGHAEGLAGVSHGLAYVGPSIFRKPGPGQRRKGGFRP